MSYKLNQGQRLAPGETLDSTSPAMAPERAAFEAELRAASPEADVSTHPDGTYRNIYLQAALEGWIGRALQASKQAEPVDFNLDVVLGPVPISHNRSSAQVRVSFDAAEGQGRVWLMDPDDNWVAIEGPAHARTLAGLLTAWADAGEEKP